MWPFAVASLFTGVANYFLRLLLRTLSYSFDKGLETVFLWLLGQMSSVFETSTVFDPTAHFFEVEYSYVLGVAKALVLPGFLGGVIYALWSASIAEVLKLVLVRLPAAVLAGGAGVAFVSLLNSLVEYICVPLEGNSAVFAHIEVFARSVGSAKSIPIFVIAIMFLLGIFAEFALWLELILRNGALYLLTATLPLTSVGLLFPWGRNWLRKTAEVLLGLELVKFVALLGVWLSLGAVVQSTLKSSASEAMSTFLSGVAMLIVAVISPYFLVKLVPLADVHLAAALESGFASSLRTVGAKAADLAAQGSSLESIDPWPDIPYSTDEVNLPPFEGYPPVYEMISGVRHSPFSRQMFGLDPDVEPTEEEVERLMRKYGVDPNRERPTIDGSFDEGGREE
jgi:hypothetical protein